MTVLFVALGAAVGAPVRYLVDRAVRTRYGGRFPWATLAVNVVASAVLGVVTGAAAAGAVGAPAQALLGTGLCGALSTYSTFAVEVVRSVELGARRVAAATVVASVVVGLAAALAGVALGSALGG